MTVTVFCIGLFPIFLFDRRRQRLLLQKRAGGKQPVAGILVQHLLQSSACAASRWISPRNAAVSKTNFTPRDGAANSSFKFVPTRRALAKTWVRKTSYVMYFVGKLVR